MGRLVQLICWPSLSFLSVNNFIYGQTKIFCFHFYVLDDPEVFLELTNLRTYTKFVHFQIYSYGYYVLNPIEHFLGKNLSKVLEYFGKPVLERLMVFQCMFHSDYSDHLLLEIDDNREDDVKANITGIKNPDLANLSNEMFKLLFAKTS